MAEVRAKLVGFAALGALVLQNCSAVLLMRYTQTRTVKEKFSPASLVVTTEVVKLCVCAGLLVVQNGVPFTLAECAKGEPTKMIVPAGLFTLQNNLLFLALANLEATLFQVTYQLKLLFTALLMVAMLDKKLIQRQWVALGALFLGIVLTQLSAKGSADKSASTAAQLVTGLVAVVVCASSSAFASVYFEKIVKQPSTSLLVRNVQLSIASLFFTIFVYTQVEGKALSVFWTGYSPVVWLLVMVQAAGGLIVAVVIKYADNILKGFATSLAIIVSGWASFMWLDFAPTNAFLSGATLVLIATALYSWPVPQNDDKK
jgi:UDP-sugar transporter A1/2/3